MSRLMIFLFLCITTVGYSQSPTSWFYTGVSMVSYKGDLSSYGKYNAAFHLGVQLNRKERLTGALNLGLGMVTGSNPLFSMEQMSGQPVPNNFFKSSFFYINYDLQYNIIKKKNLKLYISQGVGLFRFNPKNDEGESLQELKDTRANGETYRNAAVMLPTSVGVVYFLPNHYGAGLQAGFKNPLTDYIDNISAFGNTANDNILSVRFSFYVPLKYAE